MLALNIREFLNDNYYKKKNNKFYKYYNSNNIPVTLDDIILDIKYHFEKTKISKVSLIKYIINENNINIDESNIIKLNF